MTQDVNTVLASMPGSIAAYTIINADLSYTVVLNSRLSHERQLQAYQHELNHIYCGDYDKKYSADMIEFYAHGL